MRKGVLLLLLVVDLPFAMKAQETSRPSGSGVTPPTLLHKVEPEYSEEARKAKYQGTVVLYVEVGPDGSPHNLKVLHSLGMGLDYEAIKAVEQWKFRPAQRDGHPVTFAASVEVNFRLLGRINGNAPDAELQEAEIALTSGKGSLVTPSRNKHSYSAARIDASSFQYGGVLMVDLSVGDGKAAASFDIFPELASLEFDGSPTDHGSLAHAGNVPTSETATLIYQFQHGDVFVLGAEGDWSSHRKATNTYTFAARAYEDFGALLRAGSALSSPEQLEGHLEKNPDDISVRAKLITYYSGPPAIGSPTSARVGRARHILWLIEHRPETALLGYARLCTVNTAAEPLPDKETYEQGKRLWEQQLSKLPGSLLVKDHAVRYLEINDPEEAERLALEMIQNDRKYVGRLGELYGRAILGVTAADYRTGKPTQADAQVAGSRLAKRALATLQASSNEILLDSVRAVVADYDPHTRIGGGTPPDLPSVFRPGTFSAAAPQRIRVGGNVMQAHLVRQARPDYPPHAKQYGISGVVRLNAIIGKDGTIQSLTVASGDPELAQAAIEAVKQWVYEPTRIDGKPVEVVTQIDVNFTLSQ